MRNVKNIEIQMGDDIAQGVFANLAVMNHTDGEFVMDFVYLQPNAPRGKVRSRVIMTPEQTKKFMFAIQDNINKFETRYGKITIREQEQSPDLSIEQSN